MKILLVIDMQEKYLPLYDEDLLARVNSRIAEAADAGMQVFYLRNIGSPENEAEYGFAEGLLFVSENRYDKKFPSAFSNADFVEELKGLEVTDIEIIGVDGNCCVKKTCLDAVEAGYEVQLNLKCTAAKNLKIFEKTLTELKDKGVQT